MPCSGRTLPVPHFGPPMAPRRTASADLAAVRASDVRGVPWASIEHWKISGECFGGRVYARHREDALGS